MGEKENIVIESDKNIDDEDVIKFKKLYNFDIDESYEYIKKGKVFNFCSNLLYYGVGFPVLSIILKVVYGVKVEGKENIKNLKGGAISISNHVLVLDCAMVGLSLLSKRVYYTTREKSFRIPFVRKLIKLLRAIPIPKEVGNKKRFVKEITDLVERGGIAHFYPEAVLKPYCEEIREFRSGAFKIAMKNNLNILPIVITFRNPTGIRKVFKKKKDVTIKVLEAVKYEGEFNPNDVIKFKEIIREKMKAEL